MREAEGVGEGASAGWSDLEDFNRLRIELKRRLPEEVFEPQAHRGWIGLALVPVYLALAAPVVMGLTPWWASLAIGVAVGQIVTTVALIAHEVLHRSVFRSRWMQEIYGWIGFAPFLVTPGLWHGWHVLAHHGNTNDGAHDPDALDRLDRYRERRWARFVHWVTPGSGSLISYVSFTFLFTMQGQLFLWYYSRLPEFEKIRFNAVRERVLTVLLWLGWIGLGYAIGLRASLYVIVLPMIVGNVTLMAYISTNHWLRPATPDRNNPFTNTMSVITHPLCDLLHVAFSYHQEHHIFPQMSPRFAPKVREALRQIAPHAVCAVPHLAALREVFSTPALYLDDHTLARPDGSGQVRVEDATVRAAG